MRRARRNANYSSAAKLAAQFEPFSHKEIPSIDGSDLGKKYEELLSLLKTRYPDTMGGTFEDTYREFHRSAYVSEKWINMAELKATGRNGAEPKPKWLSREKVENFAVMVGVTLDSLEIKDVALLAVLESERESGGDGPRLTTKTSNPSTYGGGRIRFFEDRAALDKGTSIGATLSNAQSFEMIAFAANVLIPHEDRMRDMVRKGGALKLVVLSPDKDTDLFYSSLAKIVEDSAEMKKKELKIQRAKMALLKSFVEREQKSRVAIRFIKQTPLLYNLWIKDRGLDTVEANLSVYSYRGRKTTPVFRADASVPEFIEMAYQEFDYVWEHESSPES